MTRKRALRVPEYLQHILDAIDRATSYVAGMDVEGFEADTRTQDAVLHSLQVIGEAANKIRMAAPDFAAQYPDIPWDLIYGMRNRIVHDYFEVDLGVVWRTIQQDLPPLRLRVFAALPESPR
jgi:uncharacterized protein with HEPN domain